MNDYFCGWYFKCQSDGATVAVIPASHRTGCERSNSIQIITDSASRTFFYPYEALRKEPLGFSIGESYFGKDGVILRLSDGDFSASGRLTFGPFSPIKYDVMGPFKYMPFMECRHAVRSMSHTVGGEVNVNGVSYPLGGARGYIEGDRGHSFPSRYLWTHTFFEGGSLMLSIADIPLGVLNFTGIIGVIHYHGREYRIATYLGARACSVSNGGAVVRQGRSELTVRLLERCAIPLAAPTNGRMSRTIHESASCRASYEFKLGGKVIFSFESDRASFEYEYPD